MSMTTNKQALREAALAATGGNWVRESGDGLEAICCDDDQANAGFIIAEFQGADATANREFAQAANPATMLALLDELEADKQQIKTLESRNRRLEGIIDAAEKLIAGDRTITVKLPADYHHADGSLNTDMVNTCAVVGAFRDALKVAGITTKGE